MRMVCQFSCGAASAVATKWVLANYPPEQVVIVNAFIKEEHEDNRRFLADCEKWFGRTVTVLRDEKYGASTDEVWRRKQFIKGEHGAPCSLELKRKLLATIAQPDDVNVIGFTRGEEDRLLDLQEHFPEQVWFAPCVEQGLSHEDCLAIFDRVGIVLPLMYRMGYPNANCKGCPKGGQNYWQAIRADFPERFVQIKAIGGDRAGSQLPAVPQRAARRPAHVAGRASTGTRRHEAKAQFPLFVFLRPGGLRGGVVNPAVKCIRDATAAKGWTLADLAFVIGCPGARLGAWLHPEHLISPEQAKIFEAALSVDPYHLLIDLQFRGNFHCPQSTEKGLEKSATARPASARFSPKRRRGPAPQRPRRSLSEAWWSSRPSGVRRNERSITPSRLVRHGRRLALGHHALQRGARRHHIVSGASRRHRLVDVVEASRFHRGGVQDQSQRFPPRSKETLSAIQRLYRFLGEQGSGSAVEEMTRMGDRRYFLCPPGVITLSRVEQAFPDHGLLYARGANRVSIIREAPLREKVEHLSEVRLLQFALLHLKQNLLAAGLTVNMRELTKHPMIADRSDLLEGFLKVKRFTTEAQRHREEHGEPDDDLRRAGSPAMAGDGTDRFDDSGPGKPSRQVNSVSLCLCGEELDRRFG